VKTVRRIDAIELGLDRYYTGKLCRCGHDSERYTANGHCVTCQSDYAKTDKARRKQATRRMKSKGDSSKYYEAWYAIEDNKAKKLGYMREYNRAVANPRTRRRYKTDHVFAVATRCRARLAKALQRSGYAKNGKTQDLIGCSYEDLVSHIESQFVDGMGWHNRNEWHIDHIVPVASAKTEEELLALFHFSNLQPLWADENRKKGARLGVSQC
jgi:hypothetical protein